MSTHFSAKATKTLDFLRRKLAFAPRHTKEVAYKTLVRPKLEYAAPIWTGREGTEDSCQMDLQEMEKHQ